MIKSGGYHNLLLISDKLYGFGCNFYGQLGYSGGGNFSNLNEISFFNEKKIKNIECGRFHNLILLSFLIFIFYFHYFYLFFLLFYYLFFLNRKWRCIFIWI